MTLHNRIPKNTGVHTRKKRNILYLAAAVAFILSACSGNGGSSPATSTQTVDFDETISGYILLSTTGTTFAYSTADGSSGEVSYIAAGDGPFGQVERGFISFDLNLPAETTEIVSAELNLYLQLVANDPYTELGGQLNAHSVDYGGSLDSGDYYAVEEEGPFALSTGVSDEDSWVSADVTTAVAENWNRSENRSQFIIRFPIDNNSDSSPQGVDIEADGSSGETPYLIIEYR